MEAGDDPGKPLVVSQRQVDVLREIAPEVLLRVDESFEPSARYGIYVLLSKFPSGASECQKFFEGKPIPESVDTIAGVLSSSFSFMRPVEHPYIQMWGVRAAIGDRFDEYLIDGKEEQLEAVDILTQRILDTSLGDIDRMTPGLEKYALMEQYMPLLVFSHTLRGVPLGRVEEQIIPGHHGHFRLFSEPQLVEFYRQGVSMLHQFLQGTIEFPGVSSRDAAALRRAYLNLGL